jgi:uncharacterized protein
VIAAALAIAAGLAGTAPVEREIMVRAVDGARVSAAVTMPPGSGPHPLAVIVSGFGPVGRDGPRGLYRDLSSGLVQRGVATVRYDKRGTGASDGAPLAWLNGERLAADLGAVVVVAAALPAVDPSRVVLVGHSQGGVLALRAGAGAPVAGVVAMAAPGRPLGELGVPDRTTLRLLPAIIGPRAARATVERDPRDDAAGVEAPVLLIHGDTDRVVPIADMGRLANARAELRAPTLTLRLRGMNHRLEAGEGAAPAPPVLSAVARFAARPPS